MNEMENPRKKLLFDICRSGEKHKFLKQIKIYSINPSAYDMKDDNGKTPVHIVCRYGHIDLLRLLVEVYGCSCSSSDNTGGLPIHDACYYDQLIVVDYLVVSATSPTDCLLVTDCDGNTPFHKAHQSGSMLVIRYITDLIVNYNSMKLVLFLDQVRDIEQYSKCIHHREFDYYHDSDEIDNLPASQDKILYLLLVNKLGESPLSIACRHGHLEVIRHYFEFRLLREVIHLPKLLLVASQCGHKHIVKYLQKSEFNAFRHEISMAPVVEHPYSVHDPETNRWCIRKKTFDRSSIKDHWKLIEVQKRLSNSNFEFKVIPKLMIKYKPKRWHTVKSSTLYEDWSFSFSVSMLHFILLHGEIEYNKYLCDKNLGTIHERDFKGLLLVCCAIDNVDFLRCNIHYVSRKEESTILKCNLLHIACEWGAEKIVQFLLFEKKWDADSVNEFDETPLHIACRRGHYEITILLLDAKCNVNAKSSNTEETPLHIACCLQDTTIAYSLLEHSELRTHNDTDNFGDTPLFNTCRIGNTDLIRLMIEKGCDPMFVNNLTGEIPSYIACRKKRLDILKVLLEKSQECILNNNHLGETLLCVAMKNNALDIIEFLASHRNICNTSQPLYMYRPNLLTKHVGCNDPLLSDTTDSQDTALHLACKEENLEIVQILVKYSNVIVSNNVKNTPIHIAAVTNNVLLLKCLLQKINGSHELDSLTNENGNTALHLACLHGSLATVEVLTNYCQITSRNKVLNTPIHLAAVTNNVLPLQCLLQKMNESHELDSLINVNGNTALHLACLYGSLATVEVLTNYCQIISRNKVLNTPIHLACEHGHTEVVSYLLTKWPKDKLCDEFKNEAGDTILHIACKRDYYNIVGTLLEHCSAIYQNNCGNTCTSKAHQPIFNQDGRTYLHIACENNSEYCVSLLLKKGYEHLVNVKDSEGNTPLHYNTNGVIVDKLLKVPNCQVNSLNQEGNTPLHMACITGNKISVQLLVESERCKESLTMENSSGHTPLYYAKDRDSINCLILNGANPKDVADTKRVQYIDDMFKRHKGQNPLDPTVTALVLGNSLAGKTTLIKSLTKAYNWESVSTIRKPSIGQVESDEVERTSGVEISEYKVLKDVVPRVLFYDFAGQPEFQSTHSKLLQNLLTFSTSPNPSPILFIIIVDITSPEMLTQLAYWVNFIENCPPPLIKPDVIVIGSHSDKLEKESHQIIQSLKARTKLKMKDNSEVNFVEYPIFLDCRKQTGDELQKVKHILWTTARNLSKGADLDIRCHIVFAHLYEHFSQEPVQLSHLLRSLRKQHKFGETTLPFTKDKLIELLKGMHCRQHILLFECDTDSKEFWILTAKAQSLMFKEVSGKLFASEVFLNHAKIESNVGVLSSSQLKRMFPQNVIDNNLLMQFLEYSEICKKIEDKKTLELIENVNPTPLLSDAEEVTMCTDQEHTLPLNQQDTFLTTDESTSDIVYESRPVDSEYFFFPGLVKAVRKNLHIWKANVTKYRYTSGWLFKCNEESFFNTHFLQALLMRLTFKFAAASYPENALHRNCLIWKNGVLWSTQWVQILVEMIDQNQGLIVFVRCRQESEVEAVKFRSAILKEISEVKEKHCRATKVTQFVIVNPHFNEEGLLPKNTQKVSVKSLLSAIRNGEVSVNDTECEVHYINELLIFEPYAGIQRNFLTKLFNVDSLQETASEDIKSKLSKYFKNADANPKHIDHVIQEIHDHDQPIVYQNIREVFDKYSVFHGKHPFDLMHTLL